MSVVTASAAATGRGRAFAIGTVIKAGPPKPPRWKRSLEAHRLYHVVEDILEHIADLFFRRRGQPKPGTP